MGGGTAAPRAPRGAAVLCLRVGAKGRRMVTAGGWRPVRGAGRGHSWRGGAEGPGRGSGAPVGPAAAGAARGLTGGEAAQCDPP